MEKYPESGRVEDAGEDDCVGLCAGGCNGVDGGVNLSTTKVIEFILSSLELRWRVDVATLIEDARADCDEGVLRGMAVVAGLKLCFRSASCDLRCGTMDCCWGC